MKTTQRKAMQQALEALEVYATHRQLPGPCPVRDVEYALREALAEPVQEWVSAPMNAIFKMFHYGEEVESDDGMAMQVPLDIWNDAFEVFDSLPDFAPPQRKPLTDEEIWELAANCLNSVAGRLQFGRAIEAAHGIKENT